MTAELKIRNGQLELTENNQTPWSIEANSILLIGEYTTEDGPFVDDYFFIFGNSDGTLYTVSNDHANDPTLWIELSNILNSHVKPELVNSTHFNSRIMFPENLIGEPLFNLITSGSGEFELSEQASAQLKNGL
ncbi:MAG: hypothetical protein RIC35_09475 [Marinoscillum sp.]